jgi:hypothetical protein
VRSVEGETHVQLAREAGETALPVHGRKNLVGELEWLLDDDDVPGFVPSDDLLGSAQPSPAQLGSAHAREDSPSGILAAPCI